jgi:mono/diheme cytochrome c family protein
MPGWGKTLSEQQTWQLVTFLSHLRDLPPGAKQVFTEYNAATAVAPKQQ